jgi:putative glutamine amidotransferase
VARIGVTARAPRARELEEYRDALVAVDAEVIVLENRPEQIAADLARVDGLLLTGGADVDPALYRAPPLAKTRPAARERDDYEIALVRAARERDVPLLAICRGAQIANVAFGGTLVQDIPELVGTAIPHSIENERGVIAPHVVTIDAGSRLRRIVGGTELATGSRHHQAIERVADDLRAVAHTPDGVVETLEARFAARFWLAVQWHPESTVALDGGASRALFAALAAACR